MPSRRPRKYVPISHLPVSCNALDPWKNRCTTPPRDGSLWCTRHDEERVKLYTNYKSYHATLKAFPENSICYDVSAIRVCSSAETIKMWHKALTDKCALYTRCIDARAYFTERFFGNDMDFGHKAFWESLKTQRAEVQSLIEEVDRRAYELFLRKQNAFWVLQKKQEEADDACGDTSDLDRRPPLLGPRGAKSITSPSSDNVGPVEDPLDVALRWKRMLLWEKIRTHLARFGALPQSRFFKERLNVIYACVRRAIYTDASLMQFAINYRTVAALLRDKTLEVPIVEKLWNAIRNLPVTLMRAAVDDVVRTTGQGSDEEYVVLLGGKVYKEPSRERWPLHAWGHMAAIHSCYPCLRKVCTTVEDICDLTKYALIALPVGYLSQPDEEVLKYNWDINEMRFLQICGFIPNAVQDRGPRYVVSKCNCPFQRNCAHWSEKRTNPMLYAGLSLEDPMAEEFVEACMQHPDFRVCTQRGKDGPIVRSHEKLCGQRLRQAATRGALRYTEFEDSEVDERIEGALEYAPPIVPPDRFLEDCFRVVIIDDGEGELKDFVKKLVQVWVDVYEVEDEVELFCVIAESYGGELETTKSDVCPMLPNVDRDVAKSYKRLWGVNPPSDFQDYSRDARSVESGWRKEFQ
ncbi:hypothetical protein BV25DRAFT_1857922 [Artomyces pyxidatus]|uniref:Uncharacterized protein n=1 Tax=Artomyces pyxidatus TaxID=48021 RepID=A0ACB8SYC8_9AGAM|nr:hypothetical protein BV25DRAFT_1857922 [Artomyces pyxidatus]